MDQNQNLKNIILQGSIAQNAGEVDISITVVLQITSVYCAPNIIELS